MTLETLLIEIDSLTAQERSRLLELLTSRKTTDEQVGHERPRSILELRGLGKELWRGVDAQQYVDEIRNEWDCLQRPLRSIHPHVV